MILYIRLNCGAVGFSHTSRPSGFPLKKTRVCRRLEARPQKRTRGRAARAVHCGRAVAAAHPDEQSRSMLRLEAARHRGARGAQAEPACVRPRRGCARQRRKQRPTRQSVRSGLCPAGAPLSHARFCERRRLSRLRRTRLAGSVPRGYGTAAPFPRAFQGCRGRICIPSAVCLSTLYLTSAGTLLPLCVTWQTWDDVFNDNARLITHDDAERESQDDSSSAVVQCLPTKRDAPPSSTAVAAPSLQTQARQATLRAPGRARARACVAARRCACGSCAACLAGTCPLCYAYCKRMRRRDLTCVHRAPELRPIHPLEAFPRKNLSPRRRKNLPPRRRQNRPPPHLPAQMLAAHRLRVSSNVRMLRVHKETHPVTHARTRPCTRPPSLPNSHHLFFSMCAGPIPPPPLIPPSPRMSIPPQALRVSPQAASARCSRVRLSVSILSPKHLTQS
jgi:hypothetical protein